MLSWYLRLLKSSTKKASICAPLFNGKPVNGKSIMNIMAACIKFGAELEIKCEGPDEEAALAKAVELVESGLGDAE